ncbi:MAG: spermine synthase [Verrucomicrobia bacterium]|nr:spermine synthase [Verrucomicrobiota bacterium]
MSTGQTASEIQLAEAAAKELGRPGARVLIGGLGFGFTLRRVLELTPSDAEVVVAEILPPVVQWNREFLREVNGALLDDPRVRLHLGDVFAAMANARRGAFRAILLDVDNGPVAMVNAQNARLYARRGLAEVRRALAPDGVAAFWSAAEDRSFPNRLREAGFEVEQQHAKAHARAKRDAHVIYVARPAGR